MIIWLLCYLWLPAVDGTADASTSSHPLQRYVYWYAYE